MRAPIRMAAAVAAFVMISSIASAACVDRVDISQASGEGVSSLPETICSASVMSAALESAKVLDTFFDADGDDMFVSHAEAIKAGKLTEAEMKAQSAKVIKIEFRAGGILASSMARVRKKIEQYMAETYVALFDQQVPLRSVNISALYPMSNGEQGVVYGTEVFDEGGFYGPGNRPKGWKVWRLHRDLK